VPWGSACDGKEKMKEMEGRREEVEKSYISQDYKRIRTKIIP
jgi:hypothetical protein